MIPFITNKISIDCFEGYTFFDRYIVDDRITFRLHIMLDRIKLDTIDDEITNVTV